MIIDELSPAQVEVERQKWAFMNEARVEKGLKPIPMPTDLELSEGKLRFVSRTGRGGGFIKTTVTELEAKGLKGIRAADRRNTYLMYGGGAVGVAVLIYMLTRKKKRKS